MKKALIVIAAVFGFALVASAQPKAIGGRLGYGLEASYQHFLGNPNLLEVNLGLDLLGGEPGFRATGTYNFTFAQPNWTPRGNWAWWDLNTPSGSLSSFQQTCVLPSESATASSGLMVSHMVSSRRLA